jgi:protein-S-isoprenylcysteine O-methyltransferase Ste14
MPLKYLLITIVALWVLAENILSYKTRVKRGQSKTQDGYSLQVVLIVSYISSFSAVYFGIKRIGMIPMDRYLSAAMGIFFILLGIIIRWTAIFTLRKYFSVYVRIREDHKVIKNGLYRYIRHPSYTGGLITYFGIGLYFCSWLSILVMIVPLFLAYLYRIHFEEKALTQALGNDYIVYAKSTKRLIPGIY